MMPVRSKEKVEVKKKKTEAVIETPVDLSFLPEEYLSRINEILDAYLGLGMKYSNMEMVDDNTPSFPNSMSSLSSPELGDVLGKYTSWYSFAIDKSKYIAVALNFIEEELKDALDDELGGLVKEKGNIEAKKSAARATTSYRTILQYAQRLRGMKIMLDSELDNYDKCISTLSREVSRREHSGGF